MRYREDQLPKRIPRILFENQKVTENGAKVVQKVPPRVIVSELCEGRRTEVVRRAACARRHHWQIRVRTARSG